MVFNLGAIHDINTGIILTLLVIAFLKSRSLGYHAVTGSIALTLFMLTILPTPIHGTGIWGIITLLTTYVYLYKIWGKNQEITLLVMTALLLMMLNIVLGLKLRGII